MSDSKMGGRLTTLLARFRKANHIGFAIIGWFVGLTLAALLLPPPDFGLRHGSRIVPIMLTIGAIWALYTAVAIPLYFDRAWRRLGTVPNKTAYAWWLGFETLVGVSLLSAIIYAIGR